MTDLQKELNKAQNANYADKWVTSTNNRGETVYTNNVLGMIITKHSLSTEDIEQIRQKFHNAEQ